MASSSDPRPEDEAARTLADIYRLAQERIALEAALLTLSEWRHVAPGAPEQGPWLGRLARKILGLQNRSQRLARRYYNAARAIQGGQALPNPYGNDYPSLVPLTRLLDDFRDVVDEVNFDSARRETRSQRRSRREGDSARQDRIESRSEKVSDTLDRALDKLERDHKHTLDVSVEWDRDQQWQEAKRNADQVERDFRESMQQEIRELRDKLRQIEQEDELKDEQERRSLAEQRKLMEKAQREAAYKAANKAASKASNPGQDQINDQMENDDLVVRYQRITGRNPCAFCSLLASRGPVYKSEKSASFKPHSACACAAIPIFSDSPDLSPRDKFFMENYGTAQRQADETRKRAPNKNGTSNDGLNNWRRWLAEQYRLGRVPSQDIYTP